LARSRPSSAPRAARDGPAAPPPSRGPRAAPRPPSPPPFPEPSTGRGSVSGRPPSVAGVIAKVEPLTTARALRGPFDYRLGERHGDLRAGSVLLVPFGRRRVLGGVVAPAAG